MDATSCSDSGKATASAGWASCQVGSSACWVRTANAVDSRSPSSSRNRAMAAVLVVVSNIGFPLVVCACGMGKA